MGTRIGYYKNLDGVRAIVALMVMVYHFFAFRMQGVRPSARSSSSSTSEGPAWTSFSFCPAS